MRQRFDVSELQNALQASNESRERLEKERFDLDQELAASHKEKKRLQGERAAARIQNDELRANLSSAYNGIGQHRKKMAESQKESKEYKSKETWRDLPLTLYNREQSPSPEMPQSAHLTSTSRPPQQ